MNGGKISDNIGIFPSSNGGNTGGGVYVVGTFTMNGGEISGNNINENGGGGGVYVAGIFSMNGGKISDNKIVGEYNPYGGGVYVDNGGTFTMSGGEISGNTISYTVSNPLIISISAPSALGGGVYVINGTFLMYGGIITNNTANNALTQNYSCGGGVYICNDSYIYGNNNSNFTKTGGIITGYSSDSTNGNVVTTNNGIQRNKGHAIYIEHSNSTLIRRKETTSGEGDNLTYIFNEPNPPTISGAWD